MQQLYLGSKVIRKGIYGMFKYIRIPTLWIREAEVGEKSQNSPQFVTVCFYRRRHPSYRLKVLGKSHFLFPKFLFIEHLLLASFSSSSILKIILLYPLLFLFFCIFIKFLYFTPIFSFLLLRISIFSQSPAWFTWFSNCKY